LETLPPCTKSHSHHHQEVREVKEEAKEEVEEAEEEEVEEEEEATSETTTFCQAAEVAEDEEEEEEEEAEATTSDDDATISISEVGEPEEEARSEQEEQVGENLANDEEDEISANPLFRLNLADDERSGRESSPVFYLDPDDWADTHNSKQSVEEEGAEDKLQINHFMKASTASIPQSPSSPVLPLQCGCKKPHCCTTDPMQVLHESDSWKSSGDEGTISPMLLRNNLYSPLGRMRSISLLASSVSVPSFQHRLSLSPEPGSIVATRKLSLAEGILQPPTRGSATRRMRKVPIPLLYATKNGMMVRVARDQSCHGRNCFACLNSPSACMRFRMGLPAHSPVACRLRDNSKAILVRSFSKQLAVNFAKLPAAKPCMVRSSVGKPSLQSVCHARSRKQRARFLDSYQFFGAKANEDVRIEGGNHPDCN
jgi:chemotaxis protein histidine kinase CheA